MSTAPATPGPGKTSQPTTRPRLDEDGRRERLEAFHATLSAQVLSLTTSQAWTAWLGTAARFHHYSTLNTVAIWAQRSDATQVAGYRVWQSMGRQVRKGEQGIQILAPVTRRPDQPDPDGPDGRDKDHDSARPSPAVAGQDHPPAGARRVVGYRIAHVFDISQTDGDPLAQLADIRPRLLTGQAPEHLWDGLALQVSEAGYHLADEALSNGANGQTNYTNRSVLIHPDLDPAHRVKTLAHELGHITLHEPGDSSDASTFAASCRGRIEVEAESVAFLVTSARGMDSSQFSFPYVAGWAQQSKDVEATLRETASRALSTAHKILDRLDRDNPAPRDVAEDQAPTIVHTPRRRTQHEAHRPAAPNRAPDVGMSR